MRSSVAASEARAGSSISPAGLVEILLSSLEALAAAGQVDAACRLAGQACAALRGNNPAAWRQFDVFLHRMSKHAP